MNQIVTHELAMSLSKMYPGMRVLDMFGGIRLDYNGRWVFIDGNTESILEQADTFYSNWSYYPRTSQGYVLPSQGYDNF